MAKNREFYFWNESGQEEKTTQLVWNEQLSQFNQNLKIKS